MKEIKVTQEIRVEPDDYNLALVGRVYVNGVRTSVYIEYNENTEHHFSSEQLSILRDQIF